MIFLYNKKTNEVKLISDKKIEFSNKNFATKEIKPTKEQQAEIDNGYKLRIIKGKLKTEKPNRMIYKEQKESIKEFKEKAEKGELSNNEIQQIINTLI